MLTLETPVATSLAEPSCLYFGLCGGCSYQHLTYESELRIKQAGLEKIFRDQEIAADIEPIVASPSVYHYRNRIDLAIKRSKKWGTGAGYQVPHSGRIIPIESCVIARKEISDAIPSVTEQAKAAFPEDYRMGNLVMRTGDDGRVLWGGIGRRSLVRPETDYLWTEINGVKIFYSLDTFFQANLSILPALMNRIESLVRLDADTVFLDLYGGVGLFGVYFAKRVKKVLLIEQSPSSIQVARYNQRFHYLDNMEILEGPVETLLEAHGKTVGADCFVAMIDPPRKGLSEKAAQHLASLTYLDSLFYLSCHPESLARDLGLFIKRGWKIQTVVPFDFFPRTVHLETLVVLKP